MIGTANACGLALVLWSATVVRAQDTPARPLNDSLRIIRVMEVETSRGIASVIQFEYRFPGRQEVYIDGLGAVKAEGRFGYLTFGQRVEVRASSEGPVILSVPLGPPMRTMGGSELDLPAEGEFPRAFREGSWAGRGTFADHATRVVGKSFRSGYDVFQRERLNSYLTSYSALAKVPPPLFGEVSVLITHWRTPGTSAIRFQVRFLARERRDLSAWRRAESAAVLDAARQFVTNLLGHLETGDIQ